MVSEEKIFENLSQLEQVIIVTVNCYEVSQTKFISPLAIADVTPNSSVSMATTAILKNVDPFNSSRINMEISSKKFETNMMREAKFEKKIPPFFVSMTTAEKFVKMIPIFLHEFVKLDARSNPTKF